MIRNLVFIVFVFVFVSCISKGPGKEVKSKLGYLNGETYGGTNNIVPGAGIPVGYWDVKNRTTTIKGSVVYKSNGMFFPLGNQKVYLKNKDGKTIQEVLVSSGGDFTFTGKIPNGEYKVVIGGKKYSGDTVIVVNEYMIKGVRLETTDKDLNYKKVSN